MRLLCVYCSRLGLARIGRGRPSRPADRLTPALAAPQDGLTWPPQIGPPRGHGLRTEGGGVRSCPRRATAPRRSSPCFREAEVLFGQGKKVPEVVKAIGISEVSSYRWRKEYGGLN